tara:strand:- start:107667 stop:108722 length:1056 start_codon:yes stop_codon:yes gene_type:complete
MNLNTILFVAPNYKSRKGGIASVLKTYSREFQGFQFYPSVFYSNALLNVFLFPCNILGFFLKLLFNKNIKIVHIHGASRGSFYRKYIFYVISKNIFNKKVLYHIHGAEYHIFYSKASKRVQQLVENMINLCDGIIVLSKEWSDFFAKTFKPKNIFVVNNIVDFKSEKRFNEPPQTVQILFLGRIGKRKGTFDLLQTIIDNSDYFEDKIKLTIGGDGDIEKLNSLIISHKLDKTIEYVGWVDGEKKKELLTNSHVLILPSYNEGLPISLLEAMSYSMPIISTNVGGIPQILKNNLNGILIEPGNKTQIFEALKVYTENKELISKHGKASYKLVHDFFPKKVINRLEEIYKCI